MASMLNRRMIFLSASFALFLVAVPLISIGTTGGPRALLWLGFAALILGGLIPPAWRLICGPGDAEPDRETDPDTPSNSDGGSR